MLPGTEEVCQLIGVWLHREGHNTQATKPAISRWVKSIGDRNPLWTDEEYARNSPLRGIVAPPCWLYSVDDTIVAPKLPKLHTIYAGTEWQFHKWVRLGDSITAKARLIDIQEKEGQFCGSMILQIGEVLYFNQGGELIARAIAKVMRTSREGALRRGKYMGWRKYQYHLEELTTIEKAYDEEEIKGANPRYWQDVSIGEELRPIVRGPLTSEEIIQFVGATRPVKAFKNFLQYRERHPHFAYKHPETGMWDSWEASLVDDGAARSFGFPFAHDWGIDRISWVGNLLTNWMGDDGFLKRLEVKLILPNIYGDTTWCRGRVTAKSAEEGVVECEVWCENQRGWITAKGTAVVSLPCKERGRGEADN